MKVKLHSNENSAAEATDQTIRMLPGGGRLARDSEGRIAFDNDGNAIIEGGDQGFLRFALEHQGYVAKVVA